MTDSTDNARGHAITTDKAPERIWVFPTHTDKTHGYFSPSKTNRFEVEYIRADLAPLGAAKAKPLEDNLTPDWTHLIPWDAKNGDLVLQVHHILTEPVCPTASLSWEMTDQTVCCVSADTITEAVEKVLAQGRAHFSIPLDAADPSRALKPADVMADPRVVALVEALQQIKMAKFEYGTWQCVAKRQAKIARAALASITDTGGRKDGD